MLRLLFSIVRNVGLFECVLLIFLSFSLSACCLFFVGLVRSLYHLDHMSQIQIQIMFLSLSFFLHLPLSYEKKNKKILKKAKQVMARSFVSGGLLATRQKYWQRAKKARE